VTPRRLARAFTLIEAMVVVAIVATLATIALPSYADYVRRSRLLEAVARLADARTRMEAYFLDERSYVDGAGACGAAPPPSATADAFTLTCTGTASTFVYTATGRDDKGMAAFAYAVDHTGAQSTVTLPPAWVKTADCWTIRADGLCA
jgi:type IV pilus assembly protein PilE